MSASHKVAFLDGGLALICAALCGWLVRVSNEAAAEAIRRYGHNVDSGALEWIAAVVYCAPVALLFSLAAVSLWRGWRIRWYAHWVAVAGAVVPLLVPGIAFIAR
jgi:hypothetical protein